jgi:peptidyl-prolyl cis-trans isomerase B (cyclophilin B)
MAVSSRAVRTGRSRSLLAVVAAAAILSSVSACGGDDSGKGKTNATTGATGTSGATGGGKCQPARKPAPKRVSNQRKPSLRLSAGKTYTAVVETNCGSFTIKLDSRQAPRTGGSFVTLARKGFYDGLTFHRIVTGFVIQGGDPSGNGSGGPGYSVREAPPNDVVYSEGVVAMAKTQAEPPGTSGSQFFVVTSDDAQLPADYALLGKVTKGLDVVHRIEEVPAGPDEAPVEPVVIKRVRVKTG